MSRRFEYDELSADEFRDMLDAIEMQGDTFARLTGVNHRTVQKWLSGENDIPHWPRLLLAHWQENPFLIPAARTITALALRIDRTRPDETYPYLKGDDI